MCPGPIEQMLAEITLYVSRNISISRSEVKAWRNFGDSSANERHLKPLDKIDSYIHLRKKKKLLSSYMCIRHCFNHWGFNNEPNESPTERLQTREVVTCAVYVGWCECWGGGGGRRGEEQGREHVDMGTALSGVVQSVVTLRQAEGAGERQVEGLWPGSLSGTLRMHQCHEQRQRACRPTSGPWFIRVKWKTRAKEWHDQHVCVCFF